MLSLETTLVAPAFALAFCLVVQFAWFGFQAVCFDHAVNAAAWHISPQDARSADHEDVVHDAIVADWAPLNESRLTVEDARIESRVEERSSPANGPLDRDLYLVERTTRTVRTVSARAKVGYVVDPLVPLPGFGPVVLSRALDRTFVANARFEVS